MPAKRKAAAKKVDVPNPGIGTRPAWVGSPPDSCDICNNDIKVSFVDGATRQGPWGCMCSLCFMQCGVGLGPGMGQRYQRNAGDGKWYKVGG